MTIARNVIKVFSVCHVSSVNLLSISTQKQDSASKKDVDLSEMISHATSVILASTCFMTSRHASHDALQTMHNMKTCSSVDRFALRTNMLEAMTKLVLTAQPQFHSLQNALMVLTEQLL